MLKERENAPQGQSPASWTTAAGVARRKPVPRALAPEPVKIPAPRAVPGPITIPLPQTGDSGKPRVPRHIQPVNPAPDVPEHGSASGVLPRGAPVRRGQGGKEQPRGGQEKSDAVARRVMEETDSLGAAGLGSTPSVAQQQGPVRVKVLRAGYKPPVCEDEA